jgi:hypothetical protein
MSSVVDTKSPGSHSTVEKSAGGTAHHDIPMPAVVVGPQKQDSTTAMVNGNVQSVPSSQQHVEISQSAATKVGSSTDVATPSFILHNTKYVVLLGRL